MACNNDMGGLYSKKAFLALNKRSVSFGDFWLEPSYTRGIIGLFLVSPWWVLSTTAK